MSNKADGEAELLETIEAMPDSFRHMGERLHKIFSKTVPSLTPRTWYGMPAYELDGTTVCFFRVDADYMTFGFTEHADLTPDETTSHQLIPCAWFFTTLDDETEAKVEEIILRAFG